MLFSQPKLQKAVHQPPSTTSQAVVPPSGGAGGEGLGGAAFSESEISCCELTRALPLVLSMGVADASVCSDFSNCDIVYTWTDTVSTS